MTHYKKWYYVSNVVAVVNIVFCVCGIFKIHDLKWVAFALIAVQLFAGYKYMRRNHV